MNLNQPKTQFIAYATLHGIICALSILAAVIVAHSIIYEAESRLLAKEYECDIQMRHDVMTVPCKVNNERIVLSVK